MARTRSSSRSTTPSNTVDVPTTSEDETLTNSREETSQMRKPRPGTDRAGQAVRRTCQEVTRPLSPRIEDLEATLPRTTKTMDTIQDRVATMECRYQAPDANDTDNPQLSQADIVATFATIRSNDNNLCLLYTSPSPRDQRGARMPSSA